MKRVFAFFAAALVLAVSCNRENPVVPGPGPEPGPEEENQLPTDCIAWMDNEDNVIFQTDVKSAIAFVSDSGMYSIYASDVENLTKDKILRDDAFGPVSSVAAVSTLFSLVGKKVDITTETLHWLMSVVFHGVWSFDIMKGELGEEVSGGYFLFNVDRDKQTCSLEIRVDNSNGNGYIWCQAEGVYVPGGENETIFEWGEMSRPVRAAFYDDSQTGKNPPLMYFTNGQIEYGADLERTTYAKILPSAAICDGQPHDIATALRDGSLQFAIRDFDSDWDVLSGSITIKHLKDHEYEISADGVEAEDHYHHFSDMPFRMFFSGELKDIHIEREIPNVFEMGGKEYKIKSCVVDLSTDVASIYILQTEGITTVEAARDADPLVINFSTSKFGTSIGLSTDRSNFAVSYGGSRWDSSNLDTGSFICHEYNPETGLLHCQVANLCLASNYKTVLKLEYKGTPTYLK